MSCRGGRQYYLILNKISMFNLNFLDLFTISTLNNIFHIKGLQRFTFYVIDDRNKDLTIKILSHLI